MTRVDKQLNDAMVWMNGKMNQQNGQDLTLEPVVRVAEIQAKTKVKRERERDWKKNLLLHTEAFQQSFTGTGCKHRAKFSFSVFYLEGYSGQ